MPLVSETGLSHIDFFVRQATVDPPSMATTVDGIVADIALEGVAIGDAILAIPPYDVVNIMYTCTAVSNGTADLNFYNAGTGTTNLDPGTWTFLVFKTAAI